MSRRGKCTKISISISTEKLRNGNVGSIAVTLSHTPLTAFLCFPSQVESGAYRKPKVVDVSAGIAT